jgi:disulfide oxidoreductase YuzD
VRSGAADVVRSIEERGLTYPVTAIDGELVYDGAVSYPAIMRGIDARIAAVAERPPDVRATRTAR